MAWRFRGSFLAGFITGVLSIILIGLASLFAAAYFLRSDMVARKAEKLKAPPIAAAGKADYNWSVVDSDGATRSMTEFQGRPIFLQFWSPECTACEAEIPAVNQLYAAVKDKGVHVVAVAADTEAAELKEVAAKMGIDYPIYTMSGALPDVFQFTAGPATFLITYDGQIGFKYIGAAKWDDPQVLLYLTMMANTADQTAAAH